MIKLSLLHNGAFSFDLLNDGWRGENCRLEVGVGHFCKEAFPVLVFCCILAVAEGGFEWESWVWITRLD